MPHRPVGALQWDLGARATAYYGALRPRTIMDAWLIQVPNGRWNGSLIGP
jgi:hypothetical protein